MRRKNSVTRNLKENITLMRKFENDESHLLRLAKRYELIIRPFQDIFEDAKVLDLGANDGKWSFAISKCGAREVIGIEARGNAVNGMMTSTIEKGKENIKIYKSDVFDMLESLAKNGEFFDVVVIYGLFYHIMDHLRLLKLCKSIGAKNIIIDSEFALRPGACIVLCKEDIRKPCNAAPLYDDIDLTVVGIPSKKAVEGMAEAIGYSCTWSENIKNFNNSRVGVQDYFRHKRKRRDICHLADER